MPYQDSIELIAPTKVIRAPATFTGCTLSVYPAHDWPKVEPVWAELAESSPYSSFYLSTDWISAWLQVFGESLDARFLVFHKGDEKLGVCLLSTSKEKRGPFSIRRMYLNTGGEEIRDRTLMEFNNILCCSGSETDVVRELGKYVSAQLWDEFAVQGASLGPVLTALQAQMLPDLQLAVRMRPTFYVNLDRLRGSGRSYLDSLSANTRAQIRRSLRLFGNLGNIRTEVAPDLPTALDFFAEMCRMHQSRWLARGEGGVFAPGLRLQFHQQLIRCAYAKKSIHLVRVSAGTETVGILYNFIRKRKVYFFQSGFNYSLAPRGKPGLLTHACAIQHYLEAGLGEYDFLAGDARYKASLAKDRGALAWVTFTRPNIKLSFIEWLRTIKQRVRRTAQAREHQVPRHHGHAIQS